VKEVNERNGREKERITGGKKNKNENPELCAFILNDILWNEQLMVTAYKRYFGDYKRKKRTNSLYCIGEKESISWTFRYRCKHASK